jgi:ferric-dicitrate binding protein FerR (iron transport regulator)
MYDRPLNDLIQSYLDGACSAEEFGELQRRIVVDPAAADAFASASGLDALLADQLLETRLATNSALLAEQAVDSYSHGDDYIASPPRQSRWSAGPIALAAAILIATGVGGWFGWQHLHVQRDGLEIARAQHRLVSGRALIDGIEGQPIRDGARIDVLDEPAAFELIDGSRAEFAPASSAILHGRADGARQVIDLLAGGARFQVKKGAGPFRVDTPIGPVSVLGTEFELQLKDHPWIGEDDMQLKRFMTLSVIVLAGSVQVDIAGERVRLGAGDSQVFADEPRKDERRPEASGRFVNYNAGNNTLVIMGKERRTEITFAVAKDVKVTLNGAAGKLTDLNEKHMLQLSLNADRSTVVEISGATQAADEPRRDGGNRRVIVSVDAEKRTVTLKGERENDTYSVRDNARILVGGREAKLADLKPGTQIVVGFADDRKTVTLIRQGEGEGDRPARRDGEGGDFRGQLEKYDEKAGTIVVVRRGDGGAETRAKLLVAKDVKVEMDGAKDLKLADIAINTPISVIVNADRTTAVTIRVELRPVRRIVFDVDGEKNTVTFRVERERITLPVSKDAKITIDNKPAKLTDLKQGNVSFATMSPDGKTVVAIAVRTPEGAKDGERPAPKEGDRPPVKDGERRKDAPKEGERRKEAPKEGELKRDVPKEGEARTGTIIGELKGRNDTKDGKNTNIEVLAPGEEKARSYFVNWDPAIKGPLPKVLEAVRAAKVGDRVEFEWVGTNHGPAITKFKVLPKRGE